LFAVLAADFTTSFKAYNPLVPQRNEVVIALSIEVPEKQQVVSVVVKSFQ
jgi:hypothetical protein